MKYDEISVPMRRFLGTFEALRKLGFPSDDIYCEIARSARNRGLLSCFCKLRACGKEFSVECGPISSADVTDVTDVAADVFSHEWSRVCEAIAANAIPQADLDRIWQESEAHQNAVEFSMALLAKGIRPPATRTKEG